LRDHMSVHSGIAPISMHLPEPIPDDPVTASTSSLDPDIPIAGALSQIPRLAKVRRLSLTRVQRLLTNHEIGRFLGIFGFGTCQCI